VAPAPRIDTGAVGWYAAAEDVTDAIEVSDMVADVIIDVSEDITDVSDMLEVLLIVVK
jgi:hypothetical protein